MKFIGYYDENDFVIIETKRLRVYPHNESVEQNLKQVPPMIGSDEEMSYQQELDPPNNIPFENPSKSEQMKEKII